MGNIPRQLREAVERTRRGEQGLEKLIQDRLKAERKALEELYEGIRGSDRDAGSSISSSSSSTSSLPAAVAVGTFKSEDVAEVSLTVTKTVTGGDILLRNLFGSQANNGRAGKFVEELLAATATVTPVTALAEDLRKKEALHTKKSMELTEHLVKLAKIDSQAAIALAAERGLTPPTAVDPDKLKAAQEEDAAIYLQRFADLQETVIEAKQAEAAAQQALQHRDVQSAKKSIPNLQTRLVQAKETKTAIESKIKGTKLAGIGPDGDITLAQVSNGLANRIKDGNHIFSTHFPEAAAEQQAQVTFIQKIVGSKSNGFYKFINDYYRGKDNEIINKLESIFGDYEALQPQDKTVENLTPIVTTIQRLLLEIQPGDQGQFIAAYVAQHSEVQAAQLTIDGIEQPLRAAETLVASKESDVARAVAERKAVELRIKPTGLPELLRKRLKRAEELLVSTTPVTADTLNSFITNMLSTEDNKFGRYFTAVYPGVDDAFKKPLLEIKRKYEEEFTTSDRENPDKLKEIVGEIQGLLKTIYPQTKVNEVKAQVVRQTDAVDKLVTEAKAAKAVMDEAQKKHVDAVALRTQHGTFKALLDNPAVGPAGILARLSINANNQIQIRLGEDAAAITVPLAQIDPRVEHDVQRMLKEGILMPGPDAAAVPPAPKTILLNPEVTANNTPLGAAQVLDRIRQIDARLNAIPKAIQNSFFQSVMHTISSNRVLLKQKYEDRDEHPMAKLIAAYDTTLPQDDANIKAKVVGTTGAPITPQEKALTEFTTYDQSKTVAHFLASIGMAEEPEEKGFFRRMVTSVGSLMFDPKLMNKNILNLTKDEKELIVQHVTERYYRQALNEVRKDKCLEVINAPAHAAYFGKQAALLSARAYIDTLDKPAVQIEFHANQDGWLKIKLHSKNPKLASELLKEVLGDMAKTSAAELKKIKDHKTDGLTADEVKTLFSCVVGTTPHDQKLWFVATTYAGNQTKLMQVTQKPDGKGYEKIELTKEVNTALLEALAPKIAIAANTKGYVVCDATGSGIFAKAGLAASANLRTVPNGGIYRSTGQRKATPKPEAEAQTTQAQTRTPGMGMSPGGMGSGGMN